MRSAQIRMLLLTVLVLGALSIPSAAAEPSSGWEIYLAAREAVGAGPGAELIRDYTFDLTTRLSVEGKHMELSSSVWFLVPNQVRQQIRSPQGEVVVVFDGKKGWRELAGGIQPMPAEAVVRIEADLARSHVLLTAAPDPKDVTFLRREKVAGRPTDVIQIQGVGDGPLRLYIDVETRDMVKQVFVGDAPDGTMAQVEETFSDFREISGYRWHHQRKVVRNGKPALESVTRNLKINSGLKKSDILR